MPTRTREEILTGVTVVNGYVWTTCGHCGGTGSYPSSMIPPGQCRFYCWKDRTPETYGKIPVPVDKYVKRAQAADRRQAKREREWEANRAERERKAAERRARVASPDARIARLSELTGVPVREEGPNEWDVPSRDRFALEMIGCYVRTGSLSEGQWAAVERLSAQREAEAVRKAHTAHVGEVGQRLTLSATFVGLRSFPSQFGTRYLLRFHDENGSLLVWWTGAGTEFPDFEEGQRVAVTGTVKEHGSYGGEPQTVLTRCKFSEHTNPTAVAA